ncbi:ionotropic receptor 75a [Leptinotarsa decemlineata]|uniref:ionotropic receptor 75a n=1 Tax=Leptinotarsa decemlineata TaxID=7539 RepID=UPI003D3084C1
MNLTLNENISKTYFYETYHWLIMSLSRDISHIFEPLKLSINSDVHLVIPNEKENFSIFDVYNPASEHGGIVKVIFLGMYNKAVGYMAKYSGNKYWERRNMTGVNFKSAIVIPNLTMPLETYLASDEDRQINSMHRFQSTTINYCKDMFNFSLEMQITNSWGYIQENGRFDGLVSLLERRLVDFGSSPLLFKLDRMPYVDYSYGNWILRSTFIYRRPKITQKSYEIFLRPLEKDVWITIMFLLGAILIVLKMAFSNEMKEFRKEHLGVDASWSFLVLFTLGAFCQQGATCYPRLFSSRILSVFVFLFCILVYQFYSASIVSYLLLDPPRTIFNLKDLLESQLQVGIEDILIDRNYFLQTTDPDAINLYESKIKGTANSSGFYTPSEGLDLVRKGGFAFHVETSTAYPIIEETYTNQEICEIDEVQMYRTQPMHTNLQKDSPFREMMNYCMLKLVENGNMDRLRKHWNSRKPTCIQSAKKQEIHVSLSEFSCPPLALCCGILISMIFLIIEVAPQLKNPLLKVFKKPKKMKTKSKIHPYME